MSAVWIASLIALAVSVISWLTIKFLIGFLHSRDLLDRPNERTLHHGAVPRGGGIVIAGSILAGALAMALVSGRVAFFGGLGLLVFGWAALAWRDDLQDLSPRFRLIAQTVLALLTISAFGWINTFAGIPLGWFGAVLTVLGIVWLANLYNFMDGMDGLAASQSIIASITLSFWFYMAANTELAIICLVAAASSYAFLLWNWHPAKIFMGDVGSITLGAFFATLIVIAANRHGFSVISMLLIFAVFIADATITIVLRAKRGEKVWLPHRSHFYQRLAHTGISHAKIVSAAITLMVLCSLISTITVLYHDMIAAGVLLVLAIIIGAVSWVKWYESKHSRKAR